jgi:hypothetical protein
LRGSPPGNRCVPDMLTPHWEKVALPITGWDRERKIADTRPAFVKGLASRRDGEADSQTRVDAEAFLVWVWFPLAPR